MSEQKDGQKKDDLTPQKTNTESSFKLFGELEDIISGLLEFSIRYARTFFRLSVAPLRVIETIEQVGVIKYSRPYTFLAIAAFFACLSLMTGLFLEFTNSTNDIVKILGMQLNGLSILGAFKLTIPVLGTIFVTAFMMEWIVGGSERSIVKFVCYAGGLLLILSTLITVFLYWLDSLYQITENHELITFLLFVVFLLLTIRILIAGYKWLEHNKSLRLSKPALSFSLTLGIVGLFTSLWTVLYIPNASELFQIEEFNVVGVEHDIKKGLLNFTVLYTNYSGAPIILVRDWVHVTGKVEGYIKESPSLSGNIPFKSNKSRMVRIDSWAANDAPIMQIDAGQTKWLNISVPYYRSKYPPEVDYYKVTLKIEIKDHTQHTIGGELFIRKLKPSRLFYPL